MTKPSTINESKPINENIEVNFIKEVKFNEHVNNVLLLNDKFYLLSTRSSVYCLSADDISTDCTPKLLIKNLKNLKDLKILKNLNKLVLIQNKFLRFYELNFVLIKCFELIGVRDNQTNSNNTSNTSESSNYPLTPPAPPALLDEDLLTLLNDNELPLSPSLPSNFLLDERYLSNQHADPPQLETDSSLFLNRPHLQVNHNTPLHQRRNVRRPPNLLQPPLMYHSRSKSQDFSPTNNNQNNFNIKPTNNPINLPYTDLNDINQPLFLRTIEINNKSFLLTLSLTPPDKDNKQSCPQFTTVTLFFGTPHLPLSILRSFILPNQPLDIQLSLIGDELSELILVYDQSIFALDPFTINVREIKVGRPHKKRRQRLNNSNSNTLDTLIENHGSNSNLNSNNNSNNNLNNNVTSNNNEGNDIDQSPSSNSLSSLLNNNYTNFTPPILSNNSNSNTPLTRSTTLSRFTSILQRPFTRNHNNSNNNQQQRTSSTSPNSSPPHSKPPLLPKKITFNPHYTAFIQLKIPPPLPTASLEKVWTLPPTYDDVKSIKKIKSDKKGVYKNYNNNSNNNNGNDVNILEKVWFYLDPRGNEHGPWSTKTMETWYNSKRFLTNLPVRHKDKKIFKPLSDFENVQPFYKAISNIGIPESPAASLKSLDPPTPLLPPISLISDPKLPKIGPQNIFLVSRQHQSTLLVDNNGKSIIRGNGINWDENNNTFPINNFELIYTNDDQTSAAIVAIRKTSFEVLDLADGLLTSPSEREKALPGWEYNMCRQSRILPYVHKVDNDGELLQVNCYDVDSKSCFEDYINCDRLLLCESHSDGSVKLIKLQKR